MKFAFFGTPEIAVVALEEMATFGLKPSLIITNPDAPVGRKQVLTPPPVKVWANTNSVPVIQPTSLKKPDTLPELTSAEWDFFVVFAYGKILPEWLLSLPKFGTINGHPSLLPKLRGASPIRSTLLQDLSACGVSIIQMDKELDHGPILAQQAVTLTEPVLGTNLDAQLARIVGDLLVHVMQDLPEGKINPKSQDHEKATFCTKIDKTMSELKIDPYNLPEKSEAQETYRKICAFAGWPEAYFFHDGKRFKIKSAHLESDKLVIDRIVPEGKKETDFKSYFG